MLKRRPSKRFVLAETGEETSWNTTTDNETTGIIPQIPQIDIENVAPQTNDEEEDIALENFQQQQQPEQIQSTQRLTVQQPVKSGMK